MGKIIFLLNFKMKFSLPVAAAAADASVANKATCTADKECKVATDSCCDTFADADKQTAKTPVLKICYKAVTTKETATPWVITCAGRTAGAASLAATAAAAATALYTLA